MIIYFANRKMEILDLASTHLPNGIRIKEDLKTEDVDSGVSSFECKVYYTEKTRDKVKTCVEAGNYILRKHKLDDDEFYTIIDSQESTKGMYFYLYAEDAGLDLLNEIVGPYEATEAMPIESYVNLFTKDSGFVIGINEISDLTRKLKWDSESTTTERLRSVAHQFGHAEVSYSFDIKGLEVVDKKINIYKKRGSETDVQLRQNYEVDNIEVTTSIANLATGLIVTGGTPEGKDKPILLNFQYDDGDFYTYQNRLYSRNALAKWSRYVWSNEPNPTEKGRGHILRRYNYDTLNQETLCKKAISELKKKCVPEVNYEMEILKLPENVKIGDRVNVIDDAIDFYINSRILKLETSISDGTKKAVLGEHIIKDAGISEKLTQLAEDIARKVVIKPEEAVMAHLASNKGTVISGKGRVDIHLDVIQGSRVIKDGEGMLKSILGRDAYVEWWCYSRRAYRNPPIRMPSKYINQDRFTLSFQLDDPDAEFFFKSAVEARVMRGSEVLATDRISLTRAEEPIDIVLTPSNVALVKPTTTTDIPVTVKAYKKGEQLPCEVVASECSKNTGVTVVSDGNKTSPTLTLTFDSTATAPNELLVPVHVDMGINNGTTVVNTFLSYNFMDDVKGEDAVSLCIDSTNGTLFKEKEMVTTLSLKAFKGGKELSALEIGALGKLTWTRDGVELPITALSVDVKETESSKVTFKVAIEGIGSSEVTLMRVVSVKNIFRYYKLQDASLPPPEIPSTFPPLGNSGWDDVEPPYNPETDVDKRLYVVDCNEYTDGSVGYTPVSVMSSYQVSQDAVKRALSAQQTANSLELRFVPIQQSVSNFERYIRFENGNMIVGESGPNGETVLSAVHTATSLEFQKAGQTVGAFTNDGLSTRNVVVDNRVEHFGQWATQRGSEKENSAGDYNLNDLWIGG